MREAELSLSDGRSLSYADFGAPEGQPVVYFHGAPTSRLDLVPFEDELSALGVRVVALDRPGYGGSTPKPGRVRADFTEDAKELMDVLGLDRVVILGYSAGGPYALECAATHPERVYGVGVMAGTTELSWPDAWNGYPTEHERELLQLDDPELVLARCIEVFGADGGGFAEGTLTLAPADEALLADEAMAANMFATMGEGLRQGIVGYAEDAFAESRPWTFDASAITAPVLIYHGAVDAIVPIAHSEHNAELIPTAELTVHPDHGHLSLVLEAPSLIAALL